jgi:hypothetical protein
MRAAMSKKAFTLAVAVIGSVGAIGCVVPENGSAPGSSAYRTSGDGARLGRASGDEATFASFESRKVKKLALAYPEKRIAEPPKAPISLTGSDGTGLELRVMKAKAVVKGPLAFTQLHLTFHNPESRQREGRFEITLPSGAAVSRFAMKTSRGWQEAEMVERQRARQIYEDFLHRKQDPALLEKKAGNQFRARVFPIQANSEKEIILSYSQNIESAEQAYRLPLRGLPKMRRLEITALVGRSTGSGGSGSSGSESKGSSGSSGSSLGGQVVTTRSIQVRKAEFQPTEDFVVNARTGLDGLYNGKLAAIRIRPNIPSGRAPMESLLLLVDTSASRAAGFHRQVKNVAGMIGELKRYYGGSAPIRVAAFDQSVGTIYAGPLQGFGSKQVDDLLARRPLGASDLEGALRWAGTLQSYKRVVVVSDMVITAGETDGAKLKSTVKSLSPSVERLDVVLVGGIRDKKAAKVLVTGGLEQDGAVLEGDADPAVVAAKLSQRVVSGIEVDVAGADWCWPKRIDGAQPGDGVLVFATMKPEALSGSRSGSGSSLVAVNLSGPVKQTLSVPVVETKKPLLERAWVEARIAHLEAKGAQPDIEPDIRQAIKKQIISLSTKHRVLSDYTALLVLETAADYARYGIARNALADILVVGATGVEVARRAKPLVAHRPRTDDQRPPVRRTGQPRPRGAPPAVEPDGAMPEAAKSTAARRDAPSPGPSERRPSPAPRRRMKRRSSSSRRPAPAGAPSSPPPAASSESADSPATLRETRERREERAEPKIPKGPPPLTGKLAKVDELLRKDRVEEALLTALRWRAKEPGDVLALVALGDALRHAGSKGLAARAYGSIIDLFPSRADMRRFAGERLEALGKTGAPLAVDTYEKAVEQRPDHVSAHHLLAMAQIRAGAPQKAFGTLEAGLKQTYRISRPGTMRILREDLALAGAAWAAKEPKMTQQIIQKLAKHNLRLPDRPSTRFVLVWETDANDVDFHIHDGKGGHAYYSSKELESGGKLYADVTNGYGPECFAIEGKPTAYPYSLSIHYYSKGPMGYGMGKIQIIAHDGKGNLTFADRPFVVMNDRAYVDLGQVKGPLSKSASK